MASHLQEHKLRPALQGCSPLPDDPGPTVVPFRDTKTHSASSIDPDFAETLHEYGKNKARMSSPRRSWQEVWNDFFAAHWQR